MTPTQSVVATIESAAEPPISMMPAPMREHIELSLATAPLVPLACLDKRPWAGKAVVLPGARSRSSEAQDGNVNAERGPRGVTVEYLMFAAVWCQNGANSRIFGSYRLSLAAPFETYQRGDDPVRLRTECSDQCFPPAL